MMESGNCPKCGESDIHNKEVAWECQACGYSWPKDTPPVDSKGAAIRQALKELPILKNYMITPDGKTLPTNYNLNDEDVEAILALLAQEVNKARIDEWKRLDIGVNISKDFAKRRITALERLG